MQRKRFRSGLSLAGGSLGQAATGIVEEATGPSGDALLLADGSSFFLLADNSSFFLIA